MKTIWKCPLEITDRQRVHLPAGAQLLTAQFQLGRLCLWALVDPQGNASVRTIAIVGTGNPTPESVVEYVATAQQFSGRAVWHVFEVTP